MGPAVCVTECDGDVLVFYGQRSYLQALALTCLSSSDSTFAQGLGRGGNSGHLSDPSFHVGVHQHSVGCTHQEEH